MNNFKVNDIVKVIKNLHHKSDDYETNKGLVGKVIEIQTYKDIVRYKIQIPNKLNSFTNDNNFLYRANELDYFKSEDKKKMDKSPIVDLLNIWLDRQQKIAREKCKKEKQTALNLIPGYSEIIALKEKYADNLDIAVEVKSTDKNESYRAKLVAIERKCADTCDKLLDKCKEVLAQVNLCDTYEQKQAVLRAYDIIDSKSKLN